MMSPETRSFYTGYRLLTSILPVYLLTALFFTLGWYMNPFRSGGNPFLIGGLVIFVGISHVVGWLGFQLSGVPQKTVQPEERHADKLRVALSSVDAPIEPQVVEIGNVPFLAAGGRLTPTVWISTHTIKQMETEELSCLLVHEARHLTQGCAFAWWDLLWLVAWPLSWLFANDLLYYFASAVIFAWAWLRLQGWLRFREEIIADRAAVKACGREQYAHAMVRHLAEFETVPDSPLRRSRLAALGFTEPEIEELLRDNAHSSSVP